MGKGPKVNYQAKLDWLRENYRFYRAQGRDIFYAMQQDGLFSKSTARRDSNIPKLIEAARLREEQSATDYLREFGLC
jgi:ABC-type proline/glycine betaine transport system ATPase subunit